MQKEQGCEALTWEASGGAGSLVVGESLYGATRPCQDMARPLAPDPAAVQALMEEYVRLKGSDEWKVTSDEQRPARSASSLVTRHSSLTSLRQRVVDGMAPLVESIARRYAGVREGGGSGEALEDLISEGYVGLLTAIDHYQMDRGARFSTYATHRVNGQIRHYLRDRGNRRLIRSPSWLQELTGRMNREEAALEAELGRPATLAELAERLNLQADAVEELRAHGAGPAVLSLTEEGGDDEEWGRGVDPGKIRSQHYVSWQLPVEDRIFLEGLLTRLKELERKVITLFFFQEFSQTEIARSMDISCNYVGYLLRNGLGKLRKLIEADELLDAQLRVTYAPRSIATRAAGAGCPAQGGRMTRGVGTRQTGDPSVIDAMTGLYNASYFRSRLSEEIARACRYQHELALVLFRFEDGGALATDDSGEVPRPRRGRDKGGKAEGIGPRVRSAVTRGLSRATWKELGIALRECLRKADIPARVEETTLAVALPRTGAAAAAVAERMAQLLSQVAGCPVASGLAVYPADGGSAPALLEAAEARFGSWAPGTERLDPATQPPSNPGPVVNGSSAGPV